MIAILENIVPRLTQDATLATLMGQSIPNKLIYVGDVDIVQETQKSFQYPMILIHTTHDEFSRLPLGARETHLQFDVMSKTSELQVIQIYEQMCQDLLYVSGFQGNSFIWWSRPTSATDISESEMRVWHIRAEAHFWNYDNTQPET